MLEPSELVIGSVNEDFAIESLQGDIFQFGNTSWRVLRVEQGKVRVEDAHGQPPSIPFWLGEAPARTHELSVSVARLREEVTNRVEVMATVDQSPKSKVQSRTKRSDEALKWRTRRRRCQDLTAGINLEPAINYLTDDVGISQRGRGADC